MAGNVAIEPCFRPVSIFGDGNTPQTRFSGQRCLSQAAQIAVDAQGAFTIQKAVRILCRYQRGSIRGKPPQGLDRGFRIADLLHDVTLGDMLMTAKQNVAQPRAAWSI